MKPKELEDFEALILFYFEKKHNTLSAGASIILYDDLANDANKWHKEKNGLDIKLTPTLFRNLYKKYEMEKPKRASLINPAKEYLNYFKIEWLNTENPIAKEIEKRLWQLYKTDEIDQGLLIAEEFLKDNEPTVKILKYFFRFEMRLSNFASIRSRIEQYYKYEQSGDLKDKYKALFRATIFDCELREAYELIPDNRAFYAKICEAQYLLEEIPNRLTNSEYHYLLGRFFMEKWWANQSNYRTILLQSLSQLKKANQDNWWVECYKCIVLKLLGRKKEFLSLAAQHKQHILHEQSNEPLMASLKIHSATAFIMLDEPEELKKFLKKTTKPKSSTDFNSSLQHHIDLIYYSNKGKKKIYETLIKNWG
ncbi:MAG: hypothetical protein JSS64_07720 [Bacteroidetes bacterium]|nr:hypothetical protein [Bacteroidota bacterium]